MKVLTEKKPTLSIYTGVVDYPAAETNKKVDREMAALRRELDETRAALRLQTARCRQLVAAYSARLKAGDDLRDHQLALVLRALVALEARLRREQKAIRSQLAQRDAIIHQQQVEISRLRGRSPGSAPPPPPAARTTATTPTTPSQLIVENHTCGQDSACAQDWRGSAEHETVVDAMSHLRHQEAALRVLELVGPGPPPATGAGTTTRVPTTTVLPLLNGETACIVEPPADFIEDNMAVTPPPDVVASYNDMNRECLELASMAASLRSGDKEKAVCFQDNPVLECVNLILLRDQEDFQEDRRGRNRERGPESARPRRGRRSVEESPPPPCSEPAAWYNSNGTIKDLKDAPRESAAPRRPTPPALPPKPPRLVAQRPTRNAKSPTPTKDPKDSKDNDTRTEPPTTPTPSPPSPPSPPAVSPTNSTSNSATTIATDQEESRDALRRNFEEFNLDDCDIEGLGQGEVGEAVEAALPPAEAQTEANGDGRPRLEGDGAESLKLNGHGQGQDVQDVLPLLTAPAEAPTPVSNGLGINLGPALAGTLAHQLAQLAPLAPNTLANYDTFLEATGLSNKSILTPSRMLSNHRSVLKPKDVKHRSRVKAGERCAGPTSCATGPTVKYWTEPFL